MFLISQSLLVIYLCYSRFFSQQIYLSELSCHKKLLRLTKPLQVRAERVSRNTFFILGMFFPFFFIWRYQAYSLHYNQYNYNGGSNKASNKENILSRPSPFRNVLNPNGLIAKIIKPTKIDDSIAISLNNLCFSREAQSSGEELLCALWDTIKIIVRNLH
jgi:hypothetical protein